MREATEIPGQAGHERQGSGDLTGGVSLLIGEPKKAVLKLSGPMIVALMIQAAYNLVNAVWVAGLGPTALAAVGFVAPVFMVVIGISNGLGAGVSSAISRRIGAGDKAGADSTATQAIILVIVVSAILTVCLLGLAGPILAAMGAGSSLELALEYGNIVFAGSILAVFSAMAFAILRGEGDTKRTMYAMAAGSLVNAVLDPVLIYWAGLGVAGAAWGTVFSMLLVSLVQVYWLFIKKDTYVSISMRGFCLCRNIMADILQVGIPASIEFLFYSIDAVIINAMLVRVSGTDAVAVYTAGWRVIFVALVPLIAIATAEISVAGAAFGARRFDSLSVIHSYSTKLGLGIGLATALFTGIFAPQITALFTFSVESAHLAPTLVAFMHAMCLFYPFVSPGIMSASLFQGAGKGLTSLFLNLLRDVILVTMMAFVLGMILGLGEQGIWWGIVFGNISGSLVSYLWAKLYISRLIKDKGLDSMRRD